ncbi:hypothetical protein ACOJTA_06120 [Malaciobacter sp. WC5094]
MFNVGSDIAHKASLFEGGNVGLATTKAAMHGLTRSAITKAQGGRWSSGFWSGFASSAFAANSSWGKKLGTMVTAVVSGTVSSINGGKFANGAVTGAFVHLFNRYAGYAKNEEGQSQRIKDNKDEYPNFIKFVDNGLNALDIGLSAITEAVTAVGEAIIFRKVYNPYILGGVAVAGAAKEVKLTFALEATGGRAVAQKLWHDLKNVQINSPYVNPAANPNYF